MSLGLPDAGAARYPRALDALHQQVSPGHLVRSPTGYVLASAAALPDAPPGPLSRFGAALATARGGDFAAKEAARPFANGLLRLHHELLEQVLHQVMARLGDRTADGATLLSRQLVRGQLADIALRLSEDCEVLAQLEAAQAWSRWFTHQRQVAIGRCLLRLLGAHGFLADGPGGDLHLAEVAGNIYLHPGGDGHGGSEEPDDQVSLARH